VIFAEVGRGKRSGLNVSGILGLFLALAGTLKHVPLMLQPGAYWSGIFSETLTIALILSGLSHFSLSLYALRRAMDGDSQGVQDV
jgi:hypothetical protein